MASSVHERIRRQRIAETDNMDPIDSVTRSVNRDGASLKHTIPSLAVGAMGLTDDDEVRIHVFSNGYFVEVRDGDGGN